jgi:hypothetical protein
MKALEEKLRSVGRVAWTTTFNDSKIDLFEEITSVSADAKDCRVRVRWSASIRPGVEDYYLEEITNVEVVPWTGTQLYSVGVHEWLNRGFRFRSRESAEQAAQLLREGADRCSAASPAPLRSNTTGPSLVETLTFIADKLSSQGSVTFTTKGGDPPQSFSNSYQYSAAPPNLSACTLGVHSNGAATLLPISFRRIEKIDVIPWAEAGSRWNDKDNHAYTMYRRGNEVTVSPPTFVLRITTPDGNWRDLVFSDQTLADRVAKAMVHAAELCGAGSKPEPF